MQKNLKKTTSFKTVKKKTVKIRKIAFSLGNFWEWIKRASKNRFTFNDWASYS